MSLLVTIGIFAVIVLATVVLFVSFRDRVNVARLLRDIFESRARPNGQQSREDEFRESLVHQLKATDPHEFNFGDFLERAGASRQIANRVAADVYASFYELARVDGVIEPKEKRNLVALAAALRLSQDTVQAIKQRVELRRKARSAV